MANKKTRDYKTLFAAIRRTRLRMCGFITLLAFVVLFLLADRSIPRDPKVVAETTFPLRSHSTLPKILHQSWRDATSIPGPQREWTKELREMFPTHEYMLWTDDKIVNFMETKYPWFMKYFDQLPVPVMKLDAARCFILYEYGGLFLDMDYQVKENFWNRLPDTYPAVIESPWFWFLEKTQNSFMSSPKGHPFWNVTWEVIIERIPGTGPVYVTGPLMIDEAIRRWPGEVGVLPCENWQRPALGDAGGYSGFKHTLTREVGARLGLIRKCGNVHDQYYQFGVHHQTTTWD